MQGASYYVGMTKGCFKRWIAISLVGSGVQADGRRARDGSLGRWHRGEGKWHKAGRKDIC